MMTKNLEETLQVHGTLTTERLVLRKFVEADTQDVLEYGSDAETLRHLSWDGVSSLQEALQTIVTYYQPRPCAFAITLKESNKCIGCLDLRLEAAHEKSGFGYVLSRAYWGKGYMTEALAAALALCFETLGLNRVESTHYLGNESSGRVMQKCGMRLEGIGRQELKIKGIFRDVAHYAITKQDWFARVK